MKIWLKWLAFFAVICVCVMTLQLIKRYQLIQNFNLIVMGESEDKVVQSLGKPTDIETFPKEDMKEAYWEGFPGKINPKLVKTKVCVKEYMYSSPMLWIFADIWVIGFDQNNKVVSKYSFKHDF